jgi:hypothetical protein
MNNHRPPEDEHQGKKGKKLVPSKDLVTTNGSGGKIPAIKSRNFTTNFLALTAAFDEQVKLFAKLCSISRERNMPIDLYREGGDVDEVRDLWAQLHKGAERCLADIQTLWPMDEFVKAVIHTSARRIFITPHRPIWRIALERW